MDDASGGGLIEALHDHRQQRTGVILALGDEELVEPFAQGLQLGLNGLVAVRPLAVFAQLAHGGTFDRH